MLDSTEFLHTINNFLIYLYIDMVDFYQLIHGISKSAVHGISKSPA